MGGSHRHTWQHRQTVCPWKSMVGSLNAFWKGMATREAWKRLFEQRKLGLCERYRWPKMWKDISSRHGPCNRIWVVDRWLRPTPVGAKHPGLHDFPEIARPLISLLHLRTDAEWKKIPSKPKKRPTTCSFQLSTTVLSWVSNTRFGGFCFGKACSMPSGEYNHMCSWIQSSTVIAFMFWRQLAMPDVATDALPTAPRGTKRNEDNPKLQRKNGTSRCSRDVKGLWNCGYWFQPVEQRACHSKRRPPVPRFVQVVHGKWQGGIEMH